MKPTTYTVQCPHGMLAFGRSTRTFANVAVFDGYVAELRRKGYLVTFSTPFNALVEVAA
jgi:hypothetical protein